MLRIPREQVLDEQRDLDLLCQDRSLQTRELFPPNAYYGNDIALKLYCGWPADRPLKVIVPHGVVFNRDYLWESERKARLPVVLAYPRYRLQTYQRATRKVVLPGTAPFVFLCRLLRAASGARAGTLFFPAHSTHGVTAQTDHAAIAKRLSALDSAYQPVRVCIYWRDYLAGRHLPYAAAGLEIVSAGHMYDPRFMVRLYHLLAMHRYASSHTSGSYIFQAIHAGCIFFHLPGFEVEFKANSPANAGDFCTQPEALNALTAFSGVRDEISTAQREIVDDFFGSPDIASPQALRDVLYLAERLDRYGVAYDRHRRRFYCLFPPGPVRAVRRVARGLLKGASFVRS